MQSRDGRVAGQTAFPLDASHAAADSLLGRQSQPAVGNSLSLRRRMPCLWIGGPWRCLL